MTTELAAGEPGVTDSCAETVRLRVVPESALPQPSSSEEAAKELPIPAIAGFDPYHSDLGALAARPERRRTLDDMRRLSEAIVRARRPR